jgi:hypothetical protein
MIRSHIVEASLSRVHQAVDIDAIPAQLTKPRTLVRLRSFVSSTANVNCFVRESVTTAKIVHVSYGIWSPTTLLDSSTSGCTAHDPNALTSCYSARVLQTQPDRSAAQCWLLARRERSCLSKPRTWRSDKSSSDVSHRPRLTGQPSDARKRTTWTRDIPLGEEVLREFHSIRQRTCASGR